MTRFASDGKETLNSCSFFWVSKLMYYVTRQPLTAVDIFSFFPGDWNTNWKKKCDAINGTAKIHTPLRQCFLQGLLFYINSHGIYISINFKFSFTFFYALFLKCLTMRFVILYEFFTHIRHDSPNACEALTYASFFFLFHLHSTSITMRIYFPQHNTIRRLDGSARNDGKV